ncbi:MAG TPA: hypothetical protein VNM46_07290 [Xanthobacteraceae bacterium]|jgi:hypothetical protein|nr:hypothetical protein [Xanthobacteraceae bacterium]
MSRQETGKITASDILVAAGCHPAMRITTLLRLESSFGNEIRLFAFFAKQEVSMGFGKGALLWLLGIPLPIILLLALFWR